jgi:hypothetical protein
MDTNKTKRKLNKKIFVLKAIHTLRTKDYLGIHAVFSGFNQAFRDYYDEDPIIEVAKLVKDGYIILTPVKGGVMLYDAEEYKKINFNRKIKEKDSENILNKIINS